MRVSPNLLPSRSLGESPAPNPERRIEGGDGHDTMDGMTKPEAAHAPAIRHLARASGQPDCCRASWLVLPVLFAALVYLPFLGSRALLDGHEVLVAQTARELARGGDWVIPHFAGQTRLQKPPLAYWLAALSYRVLGDANPFSARLPTALAAIALAGLVGWIGSRWFGPGVGLAGGLVQATMAWSLYYGKLALVDLPLTFLVSVAIFAATMDRTLPRWSLLAAPCFWLTSGLVVLAKGPVGLAVIWPTVIAYRWFRSPRPSDRSLVLSQPGIAGLAAFLVLALAWPIAVLAREPAAWDLWHAQSVGRFLEHWGPNTRPWFYYLYQVPLLTLPWTPVWLVELARTARGGFRPPIRAERDDNARSRRDEYRLLWLWALVATLFFSLSAGKRQHYVLPGLPPLSLLAAVGLVNGPQVWRRLCDRWFRTPRMGIAVVFAGALVFVLLFDGALWPIFRGRAADVAFFARNKAVLDSAERVIQFGSNDRWTAFLVDRPMVFARSASELRATIGEARDSVVLADRRRVGAALESLPGEWIADEDGAADGAPARSSLVLLRPRVMR